MRLLSGLKQYYMQKHAEGSLSPSAYKVQRQRGRAGGGQGAGGRGPRGRGAGGMMVGCGG